MDNLACAAVGTQVGIGVVATGCFDAGKPAEVACDFLAEHHTNPSLAQPEWIDPRAKRRDRQSRHAQRSSVIWGVPPELSAIEAKLFLAHKKPDILRGSVVSWEGAGSGRHVEVRYPTRSRRSAAFDELATVCKELKWRATRARGYAHRSQLRSRPAAKGNGSRGHDRGGSHRVPGPDQGVGTASAAPCASVVVFVVAAAVPFPAGPQGYEARAPPGPSHGLAQHRRRLQ